MTASDLSGSEMGKWVLSAISTVPESSTKVASTSSPSTPNAFNVTVSALLCFARLGLLLGVDRVQRDRDPGPDENLCLTDGGLGSVVQDVDSLHGATPDALNRLLQSAGSRSKVNQSACGAHRAGSPCVVLAFRLKDVCLCKEIGRVGAGYGPHPQR